MYMFRFELSILIKLEEICVVSSNIFGWIYICLIINRLKCSFNTPTLQNVQLWFAYFENEAMD
jgi:hypothetical protein